MKDTSSHLQKIKAFVVHIEYKSAKLAFSNRRTPQEALDEALGLARAITLDPVGNALVFLERNKPSTLLGSGKIQTLKNLIAESDAEILIINATVSPVQQRNLERALSVKVLDRTGLILEIFGERAHTREGVLQVELAHLEYQKSRLVRSWTHLERQRGGFGFLGGPGETQIETDRRLISERIARIKKELEGVKKTRNLHRQNRRQVPYPIVALVGYTNAGKSTLFNLLTKAQVFAHDMLFATLDPTLREVLLPSGKRIILADTVGFISDLPTHLIAAFSATLEEVIQADVLVHVRDIAHSQTEEQKQDVEKVLQTLGIDEIHRASMVEVWNKTDLLDEAQGILFTNKAKPSKTHRQVVMLSALTGEGSEDLLNLLDQKISEGFLIQKVFVSFTEGHLQAWLHAHTEILDKTIDEEQQGHLFSVRLSPKAAQQLAFLTSTHK